MPLAITLRTSLHANHFNQIFVSAINTGVPNEILLCSGFFQENFRGSAFQASLEPGFVAGLVANRITLTTVGIHHSGWLASYKQFRDNLLLAGVNITSLYKPALKWHAKIAIFKQAGQPILGVIGSSNMTSNAFGTQRNPSPPRYFNYESDVILWDETAINLFPIFNELQNSPGSSQQFIRAPYLIDENFGLSVADRLKFLEGEVLGTGLRALP